MHYATAIYTRDKVWIGLSSGAKYRVYKAMHHEIQISTEQYKILVIEIERGKVGEYDRLKVELP